MDSTPTSPAAEPAKPSVAPSAATGDVIKRGSARRPERFEREAAAAKATVRNATLVVLATTPGPWEVWVDSVYMGQAPATVAVTADRHEVAIGKDQPTLRKTVRLKANETRNVRFAD
jgi:hypothetical protein